MPFAHRLTADIPESVAREHLDLVGYVILEGLLADSDLRAIRAELRPLLDATPAGRNDFEGHDTRRVYSLLAKAPATAVLVEHPRLLAMLDGLMEPGFLLSAHLAIEIRPGETVQPWHADDGFYRPQRPGPILGLSAIWAIDDFTAENGATELIPGSHRWGRERPVDQAPFVSAVMPAGSLLLFPGSLIHRGGANRTDRYRLAVTPQFCQPWLRQQETMMLAVGDRAGAYSDRIQSMLGYSIHPPFMGHINGMHPLRRLDGAFDPARSGDAARADALLEGRGPI